jgi:hypothetical protein
MNRGYLALAGGLVLAAVIALYVLSRTGDDAGEHDSTGPKIAEVDLGKPGSRLRPITPSLPAVPGGSAVPDRSAVPGRSGSPGRDYMIGGVHVRDHRSGDHPPVELPPAIHAPHGRRIPSQLTYDLTQRLRAVVNECAANIPPEARGAKPGVDGQIMIAIKNQQATVTRATFVLRDVAASEAPVKACVEQKAVGVAAPSGDEPDVEDYGITLSLRLP